jgi:hypothetical protein
MGVTNIKTITNRLVYPITVKNGENTQQTFTVQQGSGWNGDMWVPWVHDEGYMHKCIHLVLQSGTWYIYQWHDHIYHVWNDISEKGFNSATRIPGNNHIDGEIALIVKEDEWLSLE